MELRTKPPRHLSGNFPKPRAKIPNYSDHGDPLLNLNTYSPSSRLWNKTRLRYSMEEKKKEEKGFNYLQKEEKGFNYLQKEDQSTEVLLLDTYKCIKEIELLSTRQELERKHEGGETKTDEPMESAQNSSDPKENGKLEALSKKKSQNTGSLSKIEIMEMLTDYKAQYATLPVKKIHNASDGDGFEDEELDELELRRIALASAAEKMLLAEGDDSNDSITDNPTEIHYRNVNNQAEGRKSTMHPPDSRDRTAFSNRKKIQTFSTRDRRISEGPPLRPYNRQLRSRTQALTARKTFQKKTIPSYPKRENTKKIPSDSSRNRTNSAGYNTGYTERDRSRSSVNNNLADSYPRSKSKELSSPRQSTDISPEYQTREIQKILTPDDPKEAVTRFLSLMERKSGQTGSPQANQLSDKQCSQQSKDNYEEVEMDIDSDQESPGLVFGEDGIYEDPAVVGNGEEVLPAVDNDNEVLPALLSGDTDFGDDPDYNPDLNERVVRDEFEFENEDDDENNCKDSQKSKKRKKIGTRVKWTPQELAEIQKYFKDNLTTKTTPGRRECDAAITKSKAKNGVLQHRNWETIKKKVWNLIKKL